MIVFICIDALHGMLLLEIVLHQHIQDLVIDGDLRKPNENASSNLHHLNLVEPRMLPDISDLEPLLRIRIQNILHQLPRVRSHKLWNRIISIQDLLIQICRVWVLERKVPTDEGEQYDSTAPNVHIGSVVPFSGYHFRGRITRRTAGCLQSLPCFVGVREAEVYYLNVLSVVKQQIFGLQVSIGINYEGHFI